MSLDGPFFGPEKQFIVATIANRIGSVNIKFDGGHETAERTCDYRPRLS